MTDAPDRIWAFYAPDIAEDENGATIVAHETVQHGGAHYLRATPARIHAEELLGALREVHRDLLDMRLTLLTEGEDVDPRIKRVTDILTYFLDRIEQN